MRRDGTWRWLQCTVSPVAAQGETLAGSVLVARDVTAEHEVDELKADFIATVSHELRTPLTPLKGFLTTLRRTGGEVKGHSLDRVLEAMSNQVNRLEALISDLLAVAELDSGQFDLHPEYVDLADQVAAAAEVEVGPDIADRLHVEIRQRVSAVADPLAVIRIVRALVGNAIKHTEGAVTVEIDADDDRAFVRVIDTGPGIPPWEQNRIFGRFERLGDHLQRTQGPGLGLTIARALAHRMQGDVTIESDVGTGSTFTLSLPVARRPRLRLASSE
jgi:two-component system sensor histidine kinase ResE